MHVMLGDSRLPDHTFSCRLFTGPDLNLPWVAGKVSGRLVRIKSLMVPFAGRDRNYVRGHLISSRLLRARKIDGVVHGLAAGCFDFC